MSEKRFTIETGNLHDRCPILYNGYGYTNRGFLDLVNELSDENNELKQEIEDGEECYKKLLERYDELKKELHLMHMRIMFSTVQSFKGDVSKRYKYSEETDTIYDVANHYGQYNKILDKKEIVMLLNEYETILNELKSDDVND